jgi:hypothetical protein
MQLKGEAQSRRRRRTVQLSVIVAAVLGIGCVVGIMNGRSEPLDFEIKGFETVGGSTIATVEVRNRSPWEYYSFFYDEGILFGLAEAQYVQTLKGGARTNWGIKARGAGTRIQPDGSAMVKVYVPTNGTTKIWLRFHPYLPPAKSIPQRLHLKLIRAGHVELKESFELPDRWWKPGLEETSAQR